MLKLGSFSEVAEVGQSLGGDSLLDLFFGSLSLDPLVLEGVLGRDALRRVVLQEALDQVFGIRADVVPFGLYEVRTKRLKLTIKSELALEHRVNDLLIVGAVERRISAQ